jgi:glycosyltransferase involved in cell wall biosynthesis
MRREDKLKPRIRSRVAVLMPAYNAEKFINRAVQSLGRSTFPCDVYIVDDGSQVPVAQVLVENSGVHVLRLQKNCGIAHARNSGLRTILPLSYEFVACLDADDICYPDRIAKQVEYLDGHPEVAVVGTWGRHFEEKSGATISVVRTHADAALARKTMRLNMAVVNTSAMIRTNALRTVGLYSERYRAAEDYELFRRISARFAIANIPEILVDICISQGGISLKRRHRQLLERFKIQLNYFEPMEPGAWLGLARTFLLLLVPASLHSKVKSSNSGFYGRVAALSSNGRMSGSLGSP